MSGARAQPDPSRIAEKRRQHLRASLAIGVRLAALQPRKHGRGDVELDGDLVVRQRRRDLVDLMLERFVENRIERLM